MSSLSPTANGFRLMFGRPLIGFAEIAWRWAFAVAAWFLCSGFLLAYANTLPVDATDRLLFATRQPALILRALQRIFHGSGLRFTESGFLLTIAVVVAWIVLASLGRNVTLRAIAEELHIRSAAPANRSAFSLIILNVLRVAVALAATVGIVGTAFATSGLWASTHLSVASAIRWWFLIVFLTWTAWGMLNWLLATASIFVVPTGRTAFTAIAQAADWWRERLWAIVAVGIWFGIAHAVVFSIACSAGFAVLSLAQLLGAGPLLFLTLIILALYFAATDFLIVGRLAAYLSVAHQDELSVLASTGREPVDGAGGFAIDQTELILSDVPLPAS